MRSGDDVTFVNAIGFPKLKFEEMHNSYPKLVAVTKYLNVDA